MQEAKQVTKKPRKAAKEKKPEQKEKVEVVSVQEPIQPAVNIGFVGHVDHGKTTLTERLSGKWTDTHSEELKRGITIRLGYADTTFRKCTVCGKYTTKRECSCGEATVPTRKVSFVDAPGHESLMATMLAGSMIMDGALLLIAANEECPQPQTREHVMALQIIGLKHLIVVQNKVDVVKEEQALKNYMQIKAFLKGTAYENAPIIPISAKYNVNVDLLIQAMEEHIPTPARDSTKDPLMLVARSFDINKPGTKPKDIVGGVLGGALLQGKFRRGDEIEIRPGRKVGKQNRIVYIPIVTKIVDIKTGGFSVEEIVPGGSIGLLTTLDPSIVKADALTGTVVGHVGKLPSTLETLKLEAHLLERVVGVKEELKVEPIKLHEPLMLNVNSAATIGTVTELKKNMVTCILKIPVCASIGSRVTISRRIANRFRLIGYGVIKE
ncbi:translation initiation factor IF-2 subunit gamma [Candidatus Woesearchaeota archaeon]|nr:translation initiation factor IF-2 subunit gamma [Candidatus Woesearchaeota archaeon]